MIGSSHRMVTAAAFDILSDIEGNPASLQGFLAWKDRVAEQAVQTDHFADLEFVDVEGLGRDDPHQVGAPLPDIFGDDAGTQRFGYNLASFNHFIDIRKGTGLFDDYDGYSYQKGSAHLDQFQDGADYLAHDVGGDLGSLAGVLGHVLESPKIIGGPGLGGKVDEDQNWWFNDEYVHAPGQPWYRGCSQSIERYSYFADKGIYTSLAAESQARFPRAESVGVSGKGIPYSVFMPIDNMARFWYDNYCTHPQDPTFLGPVMHAIQDASIPHHASGCIGNWHSRYESQAGAGASNWLAAGGGTIRNLVGQWNWQDPNPPGHLNPADWTRRPARNWRIDQLVTWVALHAYAAYANVYHGFRGGWQGVNAESAANLYRIATAMCVHVLRNAAPRYTPPTPDSCASFANRLAEAQRRVSIDRQWLSRNISDEQREYWDQRLAEDQHSQTIAQQDLAKCRAEQKQ